MSVKFEWKDKFSVGNEKIDSDLSPFFVPPLKLELILPKPHLTSNIPVYPDV